MERLYAYSKEKKIANVYLVVGLIIILFLTSFLVKTYEGESIGRYFDNAIKKARVEYFIKTAFSLNPNLEYMCKTESKVQIETTNHYKFFANPFMSILNYMINVDIATTDYMYEIYPFLEAREEEENTYEVFRQKEDENFTLAAAPEVSQIKEVIPYTLEQLSDFDFFKSHLYTVDSTIKVNESYFDLEYYLKQDLTFNKATGGPKILIYHTHSQESFIDSEWGKESDTIVGVGDELTRILQDEYGIEVLHLRNVYDMVDGIMDRDHAYETIEPDLEKLLAENPSIEIMIDLHRDGVKDNIKLLTYVDSKPTAQIMFFNGLCKKMVNGQMVDLVSVPNPYLKDNMSFSFQMQIKANELYPGLTRRIYLKAYRYNMHLLPRTLLIEVGAQTNTVAEVKNAMMPLAEILTEVIE